MKIGNLERELWAGIPWNGVLCMYDTLKIIAFYRTKTFELIL